MRRRGRRINKSRQLILGLLMSVLLVGTLFYIRHVVAVEPAKASDKAESREKTARTRTANKPTLSKPQPTNYTVIAQRNLFQPLVAPKATAALLPVKQVISRPVGTPATSAPQTFAPSSVPSVEATHTPARDRIAVVGAVQVGNDLYVLVEDVAKGETRTIKAGESAFGYTVKTAGVDDAVLERDGRTFTVAMGENKVGTPIRPTAETVRTPPITGAAPGSNAVPLANATLNGGIPDLANMTSDQRRQWFDQWRQSLQNMTPEQQEQARQQMRDYWRQRGEQGGFGGPGGFNGPPPPGFGGPGGFGNQ